MSANPEAMRPRAPALKQARPPQPEAEYRKQRAAAAHHNWRKTLTATKIQPARNRQMNKIMLKKTPSNTFGETA